MKKLSEVHVNELTYQDQLARLRERFQMAMSSGLFINETTTADTAMMLFRDVMLELLRDVERLRQTYNNAAHNLELQARASRAKADGCALQASSIHSVLDRTIKAVEDATREEIKKAKMEGARTKQEELRVESYQKEEEEQEFIADILVEDERRLEEGLPEVDDEDYSDEDSTEGYSEDGEYYSDEESEESDVSSDSPLL